jgi:hypothetical protein
VLAAICVAALVVGTVAAMAVTQRLRQEGPIASEIKLKAPEPGRYRICFQTPRDDTYEVAMVDSEERVARVLAPDAPLEGDPSFKKLSAHCFDWDGAGDDGVAVAPGEYRLRLSLEEADRVAISGERVTVTAPGES